MGGLPLAGLGMNKLGHKTEVTRFSGNWILGKPDAVCEQRVAAGVHDTVEGGVVGVGEGIKSVLCRRLQGALDLDQGLSKLGRFGRAIQRIIHRYSLNFWAS